MGELVTVLESLDASQADSRRRVARPWGGDSIDFDDSHPVKWISVNPGASLSLQMHYRDAEHWIVVRGAAEGTSSDRVFTFGEDQLTYGPLGQARRLVGQGNIPQEIIAVQSGGCLGGDHVVRFGDVYAHDLPPSPEWKP
jgi:mannose-1-phosphate guanylyltransferase / mannose-6-phosphate isomerase